MKYIGEKYSISAGTILVKTMFIIPNIAPAALEKSFFSFGLSLSVSFSNSFSVLSLATGFMNTILSIPFSFLWVIAEDILIETYPVLKASQWRFLVSAISSKGYAMLNSKLSFLNENLLFFYRKVLKLASSVELEGLIWRLILFSLP